MRRTVLIVDDSATVLARVEYCLHREGYEVLKAVNGKNGIDILDRAMSAGTLVSLILCDVHMPQMDGITFVTEVKKNPKWRFVPIIMFTLESLESMVAAAKNAGASAWITKPSQYSDFIELVKRFAK